MEKEIEKIKTKANGNIVFLINRLIDAERREAGNKCFITDPEEKKFRCKQYKDCNRCNDSYFLYKKNQMLGHFRI